MLHGKRCFVSLHDIRLTLFAGNLLNISPSSLAQLTSPEKQKTQKNETEDTDSDSEKENNDENETCSEDDDSASYGKKKYAKKGKAAQKRAPVLSRYEKMAEEKKAERLAFLESLKIDEVKADFSKAVKRKVKSKPRSHKRKKDLPQALPTRQSERLANGNQPSPVFSEPEIDIPYIPSEMTFSDALDPEKKYESFVEDLGIQNTSSNEQHFSYDGSIIQNLTLKEINIAKIVPQRITSMSWYPSADHLILAAGDNRGNIGIWNLDSKPCPYNFKIHTKGITCLQFNPFDPTQLVSSSNDGILRSGDMIKHKFSQLYASNEASCTYFDCLSPTTYLIALNNRQVVILDKRRKLNPSERNAIFPANASITSVNIHPVNKNIFVTAENRGSVRLWDLRSLSKYPVADITHHKQSVYSAFFSPVTGNSILTTSWDYSVCIFDSTKLAADIRLTKQMKHKNTIGTCRATWLPHSEDLFVMGKIKKHSRSIEVFDKDMNICHQLNPPSISAFNVFHPFKPVLAAGNYCGKVFVFR